MSYASHVSRVRQFMRLANQSLPDIARIPDEATRRLRAHLVLEEALETVLAFGFTVTVFSPEMPQSIIVTDKDVFKRHVHLGPTHAPDLIGIIDGSDDLTVVATGNILSCGVDPEPHLGEVDLANLRKFDEGCSTRSDGKHLKPPNWVPPDHKSLLEKVGWTP